MLHYAGACGYASAPASTSAGAVPYSPVWVSLTGGSGQFVATWGAVTELWGGVSSSSDPVTSYTVRWAADAEDVEVGATPTGSVSVGTTTRTQSVAAGTWWVSMSATNGAGESESSIAREVTVT
jgi:hypothetical protein